MTTALRPPVFRSFRQLATAIAKVPLVERMEARIKELEAEVANLDYSCEGYAEKEAEWRKLALACVFCGKVCDGFTQLRAHASWCEKNPAQAQLTTLATRATKGAR